MLAIGFWTSAAFGQLAPGAACALVDRPVLVSLAIPAGTGEQGAEGGNQAAIQLIVPATGEVLETKPARPGEVDLAKLFPRLWSAADPQVMYAQEVVGSDRVGAPVVLTPMLTPRYAPRVDRDGAPVFPGAGSKRAFTGYWVYVEQDAVVRTDKGDLTFRLRPDLAPNSVRNFRDLVGMEFYREIPVHRIASLIGQPQPDIIQFGDPTGTGQGGPGYMIDLEPSGLRHDYGVLSYARTGDPNSAGSQVIVCLNREGTAYLDGKYAAFGQLIDGGDTLRALAKAAVNADGRPLTPPMIHSITLVDAPPYGAGPRPLADPLKQSPAR